MLQCNIGGLGAVLRIHDILVWIWIRGSMPLVMDPDPRIQEAQKASVGDP